MNDFFEDLSSLTVKRDIPYVTPQIHKETKKPKSKKLHFKKGEHFLMGPIRLSWLIRAGQQSGSALHLAVHIHFLYGMEKSGSTISLNLSKFAKLWGVGLSTASRALKSLEAAGLVSVNRVSGRKSLVTLLGLEGSDTVSTVKEDESDETAQ